MLKGREYNKKNILTKITSKIKPHEIRSFDIETHGYKNKYILGGIYDETGYHSFLNKKDIIKYLEQTNKKGMYTVATNLGFDFNGIYYKTKKFLECKYIMRQSRMICNSLDGIRFIDTLNYSLNSVEALGELLKIPKMYKPKFLGKIPRNTKEWKYLKDYNSMDCRISKEFIEMLQKLCNELGCDLKITIGSTAVNLWQRKYLPCDIHKEFIDCKDFIYESYYGGRVEAYCRGMYNQRPQDKKYKLYDINSSYPFSMTKLYPLPQTAKILISKTGNLSYDKISKYMGVSDIIVECPYMKYPILPIRRDGKLLFCYGLFRGTWSHEEINYAIQNGYKIKKIYKTLYYTKSFYPFKEYATQLFKMKAEYKKRGNKIMTEVIKLLLNSLYWKNWN